MTDQEWLLQKLKVLQLEQSLFQAKQRLLQMSCKKEEGKQSIVSQPEYKSRNNIIPVEKRIKQLCYRGNPPREWLVSKDRGLRLRFITEKYGEQQKK